MSDWHTDPGPVPPQADDPGRPGDGWWSSGAVTTQLPAAPPLDAPHGPPPTPPLPPLPPPGAAGGGTAAPHEATGTGHSPGKRRAAKGIAAILVVLGLLGGGFAVGRALEDDSSSTASPTTTAARVDSTSATTPRATSTTNGSGSGSTSGTQATQAPKLDNSLEPAAAAAKAL